MILSETQMAVRDMVRGFAQDRVQPNVFADETQGSYPPELFGYLEDYRIGKTYRDGRVCQIYEGTSDIQRMVIARDL